MKMEPSHIPVMLSEAITYLKCRPGGVYVDGTVGGGGHAKAILRAIGPQGLLICIDRDEEAIERARRYLSDFSSQIIFVPDNFSRIKHILAQRDISLVDGILLDLGASGDQLLSPERGFSFQLDGPLDMRMDRRQRLDAHAVINTFPEQDLADIIKEYGEERWATRIARAIVERRKQAPIATTGELAELIVSAVPPAREKTKIHPATRTFMALRIFVNRELDCLREALGGALSSLKEGGRLVVITFHSLEDRIVKEAFREAARSCTCPPEITICVCGGESKFKLVTKKVVKPSAYEMDVNPRARSAKLRALERI